MCHCVGLNLKGYFWQGNQPWILNNSKIQTTLHDTSWFTAGTNVKKCLSFRILSVFILCSINHKFTDFKMAIHNCNKKWTVFPFWKWFFCTNIKEIFTYIQMSTFCSIVKWCVTIIIYRNCICRPRIKFCFLPYPSH